jgi:hypothetical protein
MWMPSCLCIHCAVNIAAVALVAVRWSSHTVGAHNTSNEQSQHKRMQTATIVTACCCLACLLVIASDPVRNFCNVLQRCPCSHKEHATKAVAAAAATIEIAHTDHCFRVIYKCVLCEIHVSSQQTLTYSMLAQPQPHCSIVLPNSTAQLHSAALMYAIALLLALRCQFSTACDSRSDTSALPCVAACLVCAYLLHDVYIVKVCIGSAVDCQLELAHNGSYTAHC